MKLECQIDDNDYFSISMSIQYLGDASTKKSFALYLTFKLTGCLRFYLATLLIGEVEDIQPYLQNDFSDMKVSSDQIPSQPVV